jgi:hypothetical protein
MDGKKPGKSRLRGKKLAKIGTISMIKGPGSLSSFKPLLSQGKRKPKTYLDD